MRVFTTYHPVCMCIVMKSLNGYSNVIRRRSEVFTVLQFKMVFREIDLNFYSSRWIYGCSWLLVIVARNPASVRLKPMTDERYNRPILSDDKNGRFYRSSVIGLMYYIALNWLVWVFTHSASLCAEIMQVNFTARFMVSTPNNDTKTC